MQRLIGNPLAVVHVTYREGLASVFPAQVVRPMSLLKERGHDVTLAVFAPIGEFIRPHLRQSWHRLLSETKALSRLPLYRFPSPPSRARHLWDDVYLFRQWLYRHQPAGPLILHCRGTGSAAIALRISKNDRRIRVIFDCRGFESYEHLCAADYLSDGEAPEELRGVTAKSDSVQQHVARESHAVICVSHAMQKELIRRSGISQEKTFVVPCCTDVDAGVSAIDSRESTRKMLGLQDSFVVAYCGSFREWQMPAENLAVFKILSELVSNAHLLIITNQPARFEAAADASGIAANQRTILSVPHSDVPRHLAAADIGLMIRVNSMASRVSSPVKFAEYLSCGVPPVLSDGIGDYSDLAHSAGIGLVLDSVSAPSEARADLARFLSEYRRDPVSLRRRCVAVARQQLNWPSAVNSIADIYASLQQPESAVCHQG